MDKKSYFEKFNNGLYALKSNDKFGFVDKYDRVIIPFKYDVAFHLFEGRALVGYRDISHLKIGFIDEIGREVIPLKYDGACENYFWEGLCPLILNKKCGYIDKMGNEVIPFEYDYGYIFRNGFAVVNIRDRHGIIDKNGKIVVPIKYDQIINCDDIFITELNNKRGAIDKKTSQEIIPPIKYDQIDLFYHGDAKNLLKVQLNGKWTLIDKSGREITPFKFDYIYGFNFGLAKVELNNEYGFIDQTGKGIFPAIYEKASDFKVFDNGYFAMAHVKLNGEEFFINEYGGTEYAWYRFEHISHCKSAASCLNNKYFDIGKADYNDYCFINIFDNCEDLNAADKICKQAGATKVKYRGKPIQEIITSQSMYSSPTNTNNQRTYSPPKNTKQSGGCYIATACYGSYDCTQVLTFRHFRDEYLSQTFAGRMFIKTYYALSPSFAKWLKNKYKINTFIREKFLEPIYKSLKDKY